MKPSEDGETVRRYDGRTEHAAWCDDHDHQGMCLDVLMDLTPAPEQMPSANGGPSSEQEGSRP